MLKQGPKVVAFAVASVAEPFAAAGAVGSMTVVVEIVAEAIAVVAFVVSTCFVVVEVVAKVVVAFAVVEEFGTRERILVVFVHCICYPNRMRV